MIELDASSTQRQPELANFFVSCDGCEYDLRFDYFDQIRTCPQCGKIVRLSKEYQEFLRKEKLEILQWLNLVKETIG